MSKPSGIISNRKVEALHPATLKGRGFTAGQGKNFARNNQKIYHIRGTDKCISGGNHPRGSN